MKKRKMVRIDDANIAKLDRLSEQYGASRAAVLNIILRTLDEKNFAVTIAATKAGDKHGRV